MEVPSQIQDKLDAAGVRAADVTERFVRGSGPGGQKINKTSSTVHLRHEPTGVEVRVQRERSQAANRERAWEELCEKLSARLWAMESERQQAAAKAKRRARTKSRRQKTIQVEGKRRVAAVKALRGNVRSFSE
jgi:peptide chain release factor